MSRELLASVRSKFIILILILLPVGLVGLLIQNRHTPSRPAVVWYVAPNGNDDASGQASDQPLKTIQLAIERAIPGDTIELGDGQYRQSFTTVRHGEQSKPISVKGSRRAILFGDSPHIIDINHSFIHLTGFSVDGKYGPGTDKDHYRDKLVYAQGSRAKKGVEGLKIDDMLIQNAGGECVRLRYFAHNNEVLNSTIRDCGVWDFRFNSGGKNGEGIYVGTAPEQRKDGKNPTSDIDQSKNNWIHHNTIETNGNECVDLKEGSTDNLVEHNSCTGQRDPKSGGLDARGSNNTFRYNTVFNNAGAGVRLGGDGEQDGLHNNVYNNTLSNNGTNGIKIVREPQGKICDNSFSNNKESAIGGTSGEGAQPSACNP